MDNPETITKSYNVRELSYRIHKSLQRELVKLRTEIKQGSVCYVMENTL
jgi:hypothetical protein